MVGSFARRSYRRSAALTRGGLSQRLGRDRVNQLNPVRSAAPRDALPR
jgi:hypothetical protein